MQANAAHVLALILESEGGFVNNPADPGGATNMGVTLRTLSAWRKRACTADDVRTMLRSEAEAIFRSEYLSPIRFDVLPDGLDYAVADTSTNSGPARAAKLLQGLLGVTADGVIGAHTLAALAGRDPVELVHAYSQARLAFLRSLPTWPTFGRGWAPRVARVESEACAMATGVQHGLAPAPHPLGATKAPDAPAPAPSGWAALATAILSLFRRS